MKIEKRSYSHNPWRLVTDDGRQVYTDLRDESGRIIATHHPVCGATKQEVTDWALKRLSWYIKHARHGLIPPVNWPD